MIIHTCISKKYVLSSKEAEALERAADILDNLYAYSEENGKWEAKFREAKDSLVCILEEAESDGEYSYWREDVTKDEMIEQE